MNLEALKAAIGRRRGKGLDLNIFVGGPEEEMMGGEEGEAAIPGVEGKSLEEAAMEKDLAPDAEGEESELVEGEEMPAEGGDPEAQAMHAQMLDQSEGGDPEAQAMLAQMLDQYGKSPMREKMKAMGMAKKSE